MSLKNLIAKAKNTNIRLMLFRKQEKLSNADSAFWLCVVATTTAAAAAFNKFFFSFVVILKLNKGKNSYKNIFFVYFVW